MKQFYAFVLLLFYATTAWAQLPDDTLVCDGDFPVQLNATVQGGMSYAWNTGDTTAVVSVSGPGTFTVMIVTDSSDTLHDTVIVIEWFAPDANITKVNSGPYFFFSAETSEYIDDETVYEWKLWNGAIDSGMTTTHGVSFGVGGYFTIKLKVINKCGIDSTEMTFFVDTIGGIYETAVDIGIKIWPNPASDILHISGAQDIINIEITEATGRRVIPPRPDRDKLVVHGLPNGLYLVKIETPRGMQTARFIKTNDP